MFGKQREAWFLTGLLLAALAHGLLYLTFIPPWQHYDEPNHFEYAWLIANRNEIPELGEYDQAMRLETARSMIAHGFFRDMDFLPDLSATDEPIWIGTFSQVSTPPLYYLIVSLPLRLMAGMDITSQLYAARAVSLVMYLLTILTGWAAAGEVFGRGSILRLLAPLTMALLPALNDIMTAVNSDVGAVFIFSVFIWGCLRLIRRGLHPSTLLWTIAAAVLGWFTKETTIMSAPLLAAALLFASLRGRRAWAAWALAVLAASGAAAACFAWDDAAQWTRYTFQEAPSRMETRISPLGEDVLQFVYTPEDEYHHELRQLLPVKAVKRLAGKPLTVGAWIWASRPLEGQTPLFTAYEANLTAVQKIVISETPTFYAFTLQAPEAIARAWITLRPVNGQVDAATTVYMDGILVAEGDYPADVLPQFDAGGASGTWDGKPIVNLARNPSAEAKGVRVRPWLDRLGSRVFPEQAPLSLLLTTLFDWPGAGWYINMEAQHLLRSFWAIFGWGHVRLDGLTPYRPLAIITALGILGAFLAAARRWKTLTPSLIFFIGLALIAVWGQVVIRGCIFVYYRPYFPPARNAYPAITLTAMLLTAGWGEWLGISLGRLKLPAWVKHAAYGAFFIGLDIWSLLSITRHYAG